MKQQYHHFEQITKWPKFIYDTMADIEKLKQQSNGSVTMEVYNKTIDVAVWMSRFDTNNKVNRKLNQL